MAWGRNEPLSKEELKAAGLDPEAVNAALAKGVTKDELTAFKTELNNEVKQLFTNFKDELLSLDIFKPKTTPAAGGTGGDGGSSGGTGGGSDDSSLDFITDPEAATRSVVKKAVDSTVAPLTNFVMQQTADNNLERLKNSIPEDEWKILEKDFMAQWNNDKLPLSFKANRQWVDNTIDMVRGRHIDEISEAKKKRPFTIETGGASRGDNTHEGKRTGGERKVEDLTQDEIAQADAWGLTKEEYLASLKGMKFVGV